MIIVIPARPHIVFPAHENGEISRRTVGWPERDSLFARREYIRLRAPSVRPSVMRRIVKCVLADARVRPSTGGPGELVMTVPIRVATMRLRDSSVQRDVVTGCLERS